MPHLDAGPCPGRGPRTAKCAQRVSLFRPPETQQNHCQAAQALACCPVRAKTTRVLLIPRPFCNTAPKRAGKRSAAAGRPPVPTRERFVRAKVGLREVLISPLRCDIQAFLRSPVEDTPLAVAHGEGAAIGEEAMVDKRRRSKMGTKQPHRVAEQGWAPTLFPAELLARTLRGRRWFSRRQPRRACYLENAAGQFTVWPAIGSR
ncbi:ribonuclease HI [Trypanosoma rangeli]|uniref:Ribonuclease HI n=1 Tax=Trypanosoma rangeli TaxID=5698 RepID=A0A3R7N1N8_TRYRA|nr:ribonuclease HI [Trypanosoma rangeli]RNE94860.1 ribonuclease HI [Trypanosoma rangeli]|eukprot:RNE94860.1 ribonuclease HI [Trypanosoma rangeli]